MPRNRFDRRDMLALLSASGFATLAGCVGGDDDSEVENGSEGDDGSQISLLEEEHLPGQEWEPRDDTRGPTGLSAEISDVSNSTFEWAGDGAQEVSTYAHSELASESALSEFEDIDSVEELYGMYVEAFTVDAESTVASHAEREELDVADKAVVLYAEEVDGTDYNAHAVVTDRKDVAVVGIGTIGGPPEELPFNINLSKAQELAEAIY